jgi:hypothetical protein
MACQLVGTEDSLPFQMVPRCRDGWWGWERRAGQSDGYATPRPAVPHLSPRFLCPICPSRIRTWGKCTHPRASAALRWTAGARFSLWFCSVTRHRGMRRASASPRRCWRPRGVRRRGDRGGRWMLERSEPAASRAARRYLCRPERIGARSPWVTCNSSAALEKGDGRRRKARERVFLLQDPLHNANVGIARIARDRHALALRPSHNAAEEPPSRPRTPEHTVRHT